MHWRYIKAALICGLLGFAGQGVGDFFCWHIGGASVTPYDYQCHKRMWLETEFGAQHMQANQLIWQAVFLMWLIDRGEVAVRTAAIAAFLGVSSLMAADHLRQKRSALKEASVS